MSVLTQPLQAESAGALANMAAGPEECRRALLQAQAAQPLVWLLSQGSAKAQCYSAVALRNWAAGSPSDQAAILEAGGVPALLALLGCGAAETQSNAAGALANLSAASAACKVRKSCGDLGKRLWCSTVCNALLGDVYGAGGLHGTSASACRPATACWPRQLQHSFCSVGIAQPQCMQTTFQATKLCCNNCCLFLLSCLSSRVPQQTLLPTAVQGVICANAEGLHDLIGLLSGHSPTAQANAAACLRNLSAGPEPRQAALSPAIQPLVDLATTGSNMAATASAAAALRNLAVGSPQRSATIRFLMLMSGQQVPGASAASMDACRGRPRMPEPRDAVAAPAEHSWSPHMHQLPAWSAVPAGAKSPVIAVQCCCSQEATQQPWSLHTHQLPARRAGAKPSMSMTCVLYCCCALARALTVSPLCNIASGRVHFEALLVVCCLWLTKRAARDFVCHFHAGGQSSCLDFCA